MTKPKLPKLNSKINVYEKERLLPHCPMKVVRVEKDRYGHWILTNAIDADGCYRIIEHTKFKVEVI